MTTYSKTSGAGTTSHARPVSIAELERASALSLKGIKKNPSVVPVLGCLAIGLTMATAYLIRLALFNPDVTWNSRKNPRPQDAYANKRYNLYQAEPFDVKNYKHPRPPF